MSQQFYLSGSYRGAKANDAGSTHGHRASEAARGCDTGHIVRLSTGQCYGTIRMADGRDVWFHRSDMSDRAAFNDLVIGDSVTFALQEDRISGARALGVRCDRPPRTPIA